MPTWKDRDGSAIGAAKPREVFKEELIGQKTGEFTMSERRLQLLLRRKITVWVVSGDGERFVDLFRSCWEQLPQVVRRRIPAHWRNAEDQYCPHCPRIELSDIWGDSDKCFGQVRDFGREMRFSAKKFDLLPYHAARWVIAHELAHVYQKATGRSPGELNKDENERHADKLVKEWGFPEESRILIDMLIDKYGTEEACRRAGDFESIFCGGKRQSITGGKAG